MQTAAYVTLGNRDHRGSEGSRVAIKLQTFPTYRRHPMSSPRRVVLVAALVIVLIATALLADEAPATAISTLSDSAKTVMPEMTVSQFSLEARQEPLTLNLNEREPGSPRRVSDGAALARCLQLPSSDDGKVLGLSKSAQAGNGSVSLAGFQLGYGEIFSRQYLSPHNRNGTEIEEPTTAYVKSNFSF